MRDFINAALTLPRARRAVMRQSAVETLCVNSVDSLSGAFVGAHRPTLSRHDALLRLPSVTLRPFGIFTCLDLTLTSQSCERPRGRLHRGWLRLS